MFLFKHFILKNIYVCFNILKEYHWTESQRGLLFSSPFWAFFFASLLSGIIARRFGAKWPLLIVMFTKSLLVTLTPSVASQGFDFMVAKQIVEGFIGGFVFPCAHTLMSKWIHPIERNILAPVILSGSLLGSILMVSVSGIIITSKMGWFGIFYFSGGAGIIWSVFWLLLGESSPISVKSIHVAELEFLKSIPGATTVPSSIPWFRIARSMPVWALVISQCGESWCYVMLQSWVPTYIDGVLNFNIESVSFFFNFQFRQLYESIPTLNYFTFFRTLSFLRFHIL